MGKPEEDYVIKLKSGPVLIMARVLFCLLLAGTVVFLGLGFFVDFPEKPLSEEEYAEQLYKSSGKVPEAVAYVQKQRTNRMFCLTYGTPDKVIGASYLTQGKNGKSYVKVTFRSLDGETGSVCYNAMTKTVSDVSIYNQKISNIYAGGYYAGQNDQKKEIQKHFNEEEIEIIMKYRREVVNGADSVQ